MVADPSAVSADARPQTAGTDATAQLWLSRNLWQIIICPAVFVLYCYPGQSEV